LRPMLGSLSNSSRINGNFGIASYRLADYTAAESALRRATELDPTYADAYLFLGLTRYRTNRPQEAESLLRRAVDLDPAGEG
jgi:Flp pilus assembly protein TadD